MIISRLSYLSAWSCMRAHDHGEQHACREALCYAARLWWMLWLLRQWKTGRLTGFPSASVMGPERCSCRSRRLRLGPSLRVAHAQQSGHFSLPLTTQRL